MGKPVFWFDPPQPPERGAELIKVRGDLAEPESEAGFGGAEFSPAEIRPFRPIFESKWSKSETQGSKTTRLCKDCTGVFVPGATAAAATTAAAGVSGVFRLWRFLFLCHRHILGKGLGTALSV